jgi:hypothetical protein
VDDDAHASDQVHAVDDVDTPSGLRRGGGRVNLANYFDSNSITLEGRWSTSGHRTQVTHYGRWRPFTIPMVIAASGRGRVALESKYQGRINDPAGRV